MGEVLTKTAAAVLRAMPDWSAPYEIRDRIGSGLQRKTVERRAMTLVRGGLAEYSPANHTFRQTQAGRQALTAEGDHHG